MTTTAPQAVGAITCGSGKCTVGEMIYGLSTPLRTRASYRCPHVI